MTTTRKSVPLIAPGAEKQLLRMFKEGIDSHTQDMLVAEDLVQVIEDGQIRLFGKQAQVLLAALQLYINHKEDSIESLEDGISELGQAVNS